MIRFDKNLKLINPMFQEHNLASAHDKRHFEHDKRGYARTSRILAENRRQVVSDSTYK